MIVATPHEKEWLSQCQCHDCCVNIYILRGYWLCRRLWNKQGFAWFASGYKEVATRKWKHMTQYATFVVLLSTVTVSNNAVQ